MSLFNERTDLGPRPTSVAASALLHVVAIAVLLFGIAYKPPYARISTDHYRVRELDLNMPDEQARFYPPKLPKACIESRRPRTPFRRQAVAQCPRFARCCASSARAADAPPA